MATFKLITGTASINKAVESIARRGLRLDNDIQRAGVSIIAHVRDHGDTTLAVALVKAFPRGLRVKALVAWFNEFSPMTVELTKAGVTVELDKKRTPADSKIDEAIASPWHSFKKETVKDVVTLESLIEKFEKAVVKLAKGGGCDELAAGKLIAAVEGARPVAQAKLAA